MIIIKSWILKVKYILCQTEESEVKISTPKE